MGTAPQDEVEDYCVSSDNLDNDNNESQVCHKVILSNQPHPQNCYHVAPTTVALLGKSH